MEPGTSGELAQEDKTMHKGVSVQMFQETTVNVLKFYKVEDQAILNTATGLVPDPGATSTRLPYRLFTCPHLPYKEFLKLENNLWDLEPAELATLQAWLYVSNMLQRCKK